MSLRLPKPNHASTGSRSVAVRAPVSLGGQVSEFTEEFVRHTRGEYAGQAAEKLLMQSLSSLGFTPTARAKLGLVVAQAAETESRLDRFSKRGY